MNNFMISIKRFFQNKNTVTIIGVILILLVLFLGYRYQINRAVNPVSGIPVATQTIQPRTLIESDMVDTIQVAPIVLSENVIRTKSAVVGKYTAVNTVVPEGSMFYKNTVVTKDELPDAAFVDIEKGQIPYNFPVTMASTYGNSIYPGNYIDIYMKSYNESGELMVGRLIENVKVLAVKDSSGKNVFENSEETRVPAYIIFGLDYELNILLRKASYMDEFSVDLFPVPHGTQVKTGEGETVVSSQTLKDFINANTVPNDEITAQQEADAAKESVETNE
ncbi:MAG: hypothetical protein J6G98_00965 [Bacilli bacterium]|nr:hypothetical protein [Bacilli bacterium]